MNVRDTLLLEYAVLADGETAAGQLCPSCRGGGTGEHSLSVTRDSGVLKWKCHRASCDWSGSSSSKRVDYGHEGGTRTPTTKGIVGRIYYRDADPLPPELVTYLKAKYSFNDAQLAHLGWDPDVKRVALPVPTPEGELYGCVLRSESGDVPKALAYVEEDSIAVFRNYSSKDVIIVEDIYSALRASEYMNAVAILGTHINEERIDKIKELRCRRHYLALDADAFDKTIKFATKFRSSLPMTPVRIDKDLKNHNQLELKEFFYALS